MLIDLLFPKTFTNIQQFCTINSLKMFVHKIMNKLLDKKLIVIGCDIHATCNSKLHNSQDFFSISLDSNSSLNIDIRGKLPEYLKGHFDLVMTENLDFTAYNTLNYLPYSQNGINGFDNLLAMASSNGYVFIVGSARQDEFRRSVLEKKLNYIELDEKGHCILIPKNQNLSIAEIRNSINTTKWQTLINKAVDFQHSKVIPLEHIEFCRCESYDSITKTIKSFKNLPWNEKLKKLIKDFVKQNKKKNEIDNNLLEAFQNKSLELINQAIESGNDCETSSIAQLGHEIFKQNHKLMRAFLDFLLCLTIIFPLIRIAQKKSPLFFFNQPPSQQIDLEKRLNFMVKKTKI